jgi:hypothetical protein
MHPPGRSIGGPRYAYPRRPAPPFLNIKIRSSTYPLLSAHLLLSPRLPPPALARWLSQARRPIVFEAQRSAADPARTLRRVAAAIPCCVSIPRHAMPILRRAQGALAQAASMCLPGGARADARPGHLGAHRRAPCPLKKHVARVCFKCFKCFI